jgi:hypothetical protein
MLPFGYNGITGFWVIVNKCHKEYIIAPAEEMSMPIRTKENADVVQTKK